MTNKPRILYIATFPPPIHGSSVVSQQIRDSKLLNEEFDGDFVNIGTSRTMTEIDKSGVLLKVVKLLRFLVAFLRTIWLLLSHRYDLCYCAITCHGVGFLKDCPFVLLCKMFGRKIVIHQHNKGMSGDFDKPIYRWLLQLVYRNTKVILLSWYLYSDIEKVVRKENILICPNGIKPTVNASFLSSRREKNSLNMKIFHILFLSNLLIAKGVLDLLDALEILKKKGTSFVCDFVGGETKDIDAARFAHEVKKRGLNEIVIYHGRKYGLEKNAFWNNADVFILPSHNECFPLVLMEAMEKGVACISTNVGGISDIIDDGKTGFIIHRQDVNSLVFAIEKMIINRELCQSFGQAGRRKFESSFTERIFENNMIICIHDII